jgi:hypothetical protein
VTPCRRIVLISALIIPLILILYTLSFAQLNNIIGIRLNNGSVIYGKVLNMTADVVRMEIEEGKIISVKFDDVETLIKKEGEETVPATEQPQAEQIGQKSSGVTSETVSTRKRKVSTFSAGLTTYYFDYKEDLVLPSKSTESGWLPGIWGSYTYQQNSIFYTKISTQYAAGDLTFDGSTLSGTPVKYDTNPHRFIKLEWVLGYPWAAGANVVITPYLGVGYRFWQRGRADTTSSFTSYQEDYSWGYFPAGIRVEYDINSRLRVGVNAAMNYMFGGNMKAYLSEVSSFSDMSFTLGNKIGWSAELPITYKFNLQWSLTVTPWYEYSAIGESPINAFGFYEPSSSTNQYGVNLSVNYSF